MSLEELYQEIILDHYKKPRYPGRLEGDHVEVRHYNPMCGDELTLALRLEGDRIADVAVRGSGCSISQASASVMSERVIGRSVSEALEVAEGFQRLMRSEGEPDEDLLGDGIAFAGVARYPVRVKCALLGWMAFKDALVRSVEGLEGGETLHQENGDEAAAKARKLPGEA